MAVYWTFKRTALLILRHEALWYEFVWAWPLFRITMHHVRNDCQRCARRHLVTSLERELFHNTRPATRLTQISAFNHLACEHRNGREQTQRLLNARLRVLQLVKIFRRCRTEVVAIAAEYIIKFRMQTLLRALVIAQQMQQPVETRRRCVMALRMRGKSAIIE